MKLLLDQGLPRSAAALLRGQGVDTIYVGDIVAPGPSPAPGGGGGIHPQRPTHSLYNRRWSAPVFIPSGKSHK